MDQPLQRRAHRHLAGRRGAAVAIDLRDGALLALASSPAVDPAAATVDDWLRLSRAADLPLRNRALHSTDVYSPPGSVFKIVVAAAALMNEGVVDPWKRVRCHGYDGELRVSCAHGAVHGRVDLDRALTVSCNIYFARLATQLGVSELIDREVRAHTHGYVQAFEVLESRRDGAELVVTVRLTVAEEPVELSFRRLMSATKTLLLVSESNLDGRSTASCCRRSSPIRFSPPRWWCLPPTGCALWPPRSVSRPGRSRSSVRRTRNPPGSSVCAGSPG